MNDEEFKRKLTEVANWRWSRLTGDASVKVRGHTDEPAPEYIEIINLKPRPCQYQEGHSNCHFRIYTRLYGSIPVKIQKCDTCGALVTPKGKFIAKPETHQYPGLIYKTDLNDD